MTDFNFDPDDLIIVNAKIKSKLATVSTLLVFDTGASLVVLPGRLVSAIGIKIDSDKTVQTTTATTIETVPRVIIPEVSAFGKTLTIDFPKGILSLE